MNDKVVKEDDTSNVRTISLDDGKYKIDLHDGFATTFYRNGLTWDSANQEYRYSKLILAMVSRIVELEDKVSECEKDAAKGEL